MAEHPGSPTVSRDESAPPLPLVRAKLHQPELLPGVLRRPRLTTRVDAALRRRLLLISAPAGYGKTTLLADWLTERMKAEGGRMKASEEPTEIHPSSLILHPSQIAWLTLDEADNEPRRFLAYTIAALDMLDAGRRAQATAALQQLSPPPFELVLADLLNDLAELASETVIILDDYHTISAPAIHSGMSFVIDHLPPRVHLVIATRADPPLPLARLRARGHLTELRGPDLSFTPEETAAFLLETQDLPLSREQLVALAERTEGWPAGLQLAAMALRDRPNQGALVDGLVGSNRYIVDYLLDDVFARLPTHIQSFLLQTSILRRISGPLCDAVLGVGGNDTDAYSRIILDALERDNLFLVPLDSERLWYRYHHLFAEVLRERLLSGTQAEYLATLHRRASAWYAAHGLLVDAVGHALQAGAIDDVVEIIEPIGLAITTRVGEATLRNWLPAIPESLFRARPRLALLRAWLCTADYDTAEAAVWLRVAEEALARVIAGETSAIGNVANLRGEIGALRARIATFAGDAPAVITSAEQALAWLQPENMALRTRVAKDLGYAFMVQRDLDRAEHAFAEAMVHGASAGYRYIVSMATSDYAYVRALRGALRDGVAACRRTITQVPGYASQADPGSGLPFLALADLAGERHEFAGALPALAEAAARITPGNNTSYICLMLIEARLARARGEAAVALGHIRRARFVAQQRGIGWACAILDSLEGQILLGQGDLGAAARLIERAQQQTEPPEFRFFPPGVLYAIQHHAMAPIQLRLARARAHNQQEQLRELIASLEQQIRAADRASIFWPQIKLRLLQAQVLDACGQTHDSLAVLGAALALGAPERCMSVFLEEGRPLIVLLNKLISASPAADPAIAYAVYLTEHQMPGSPLPIPPSVALPPLQMPGAPSTYSGTGPASAALPEPISSRELEVLRLMAEGQSNNEIAVTLVIAVSTVKSHVNNIFSKLGVATRTQAIARARRLSLI